MKDLTTLIEKYNRAAPRYTSYPPLPYWNNQITEKEWISHLKMSYNDETGVDLYVHVPFCESLCYYCGCNRAITKNHDVEAGFLQVVIDEWNLYQKKLGFIPKINSLHFGGGTPTFLSAANLEALLRALLVNKATGFIGSIEIDPRTLKPDQIDLFARYGITRVSLGIQDFDVEVQRAIHRMQSPEMVKKIVTQLREQNFSSINFDLIYGLPKQTLKSISETFKIVGELRPDLIAFYSYAHLPDKIKNQKLINENDLPSPEGKRELYLKGKEILEEMGYVEIGMDHFALPGSSLHQAMLDKKLHRNFMGYVDKKSNVLIGLGPTSISDSSISFAQNAKELHEYEELVHSSVLPIKFGHIHSAEDLLVQDLLQQLMCQQKLVFRKKETIPFWSEIENELNEFQDDGLIIWDEQGLSVEERGQGFIRNIALSFDFHYRTKTSTAQFSKTI